MTTIFVAEQGLYERQVTGVFSSLEKAKDAFPHVASWDVEDDGGVSSDLHVNGRATDHDDVVIITPVELDAPPTPYE